MGSTAAMGHCYAWGAHSSQHAGVQCTPFMLLCPPQACINVALSSAVFPGRGTRSGA